jgi:dATP pyrophosphohydrolase
MLAVFLISHGGTIARPVGRCPLWVESGRRARARKLTLGRRLVVVSDVQMARTPQNILVLPFRRLMDRRVVYAIFLRADDPADPFWQGVAGGVEEGETLIEAARRELREETGLLPPPGRWIALDARASVPASVFRDSILWGSGTFVVHEHAFGVEVSAGDEIALSHEHSQYRWLELDAALKLLRYDSNRTALWELNERLVRSGLA